MSLFFNALWKLKFARVTYLWINILVAKRRNETFWYENFLSRGKSELKCRSFVKIYTYLVAVGLEVEEQDVELREEINEKEREKTRNIKKLPGIGVNPTGAGKVKGSKKSHLLASVYISSLFRIERQYFYPQR